MPGIAERLHVQHHRGRPLIALAPLEQVVGRDVGAVTDRDEHRHPQLPGRRMPEQPEPARLRADRQPPGTHPRAGERRVQADLSGGVQHPPRVRADHPQARAPDDLQQPFLLPGRCRTVLLGNGGDNQHRLCPVRRRIGGELQQFITVGGNDHQLRSGLQLAHASGGPHRAHHAARVVHRRHHALKATADDVRQHRLADIARHRRGAGHRDRRGCQDRPQGCDRGQMIALIDPLLRRRGRRGIQRDGQLTERGPAAHGKAGVLEYPYHRVVVRHDFRVEAVDPALRPDRRELLQHPGPDPVPLKIVGHRHRDLGSAGLAQPVIARDSHHAAVVPADQRQAVNAASLSFRSRDRVGAPITVEAEIAAILRQAVVERPDVAEVRRHRGLQAQRRLHRATARPELAAARRRPPKPPSRLLPAIDRPHRPIMQQNASAHKDATYASSTRAARDANAAMLAAGSCA